ncbi:alpha/beta hydrolase fold protein [Mycolicibacterium canariasense]|uniref:Alpha/beta hydrolase fold protein n=1 Tax=Mycolicibacterium canariasense TaxID=228230 RepID=A0A124E2Y5_MYCCR|nr:hypothetical protein AWB94_13085 [Mycolicibacterium canariasense]GAS98224.1 alpha/beta hydrolase fold protein [Mycolicibacterium canariasense]
MEKVKRLNVEDQDIGDAQMRTISAKTMIIAGDADGVRLEHVVSMFLLRGGGDIRAAAAGVLQDIPTARLAVLAAMSHVGLSGATDLVAPMVTAFLADEPPTTPELL